MGVSVVRSVFAVLVELGGNNQDDKELRLYTIGDNARRNALVRIWSGLRTPYSRPVAFSGVVCPERRNQDVRPRMIHLHHQNHGPIKIFVIFFFQPHTHTKHFNVSSSNQPMRCTKSTLLLQIEDALR